MPEHEPLHLSADRPVLRINNSYTYWPPPVDPSRPPLARRARPENGLRMLARGRPAR